MSQSNEDRDYNPRLIRDLINALQSQSQQGNGAPEQPEPGRAPTKQRTQKKPTCSKDDSPRSVSQLYQALSIKGVDTDLDVATCVLNLSDELVNMSAGGSFKQQVLDNYIAKAGSVTTGLFVVDANTLVVDQVGGVWDFIKKAAQVVGPVVLDAAVNAVKDYIAPSASTVKGVSNNHSPTNKVTTKVNPVAFLDGLTNTAQQITDGLANIEATKAAAHYLSQVKISADGYSDDPDQLLAYSFACKQCCNVAGDQCMEAFKKILSSEEVTSLFNSEEVSAEELGGLWDIVTSVAGAAAGTVVPVLGPLAVDAASSFLKRIISSDSYQASLATESASTTKAVNGANGAKAQPQKLKLHSATSFGRALVNEDNSVNTSALYHQMDLLGTVAKAPVKKAYSAVAGDTAGRAAQVTQDVIMNYMDQNIGESKRADFLKKLQPAVSALGKVYLTMPKALQGPSDVTNDNLSNTDSTRANAIHLAMDTTVNNLLNVSQLPSQAGKRIGGDSVQGGFSVWNLIKSAAGPVLGTAISTIMPLFSQQPQAGQA